MPEPTSPQFDDLWTATYSPSGPRHNPNPFPSGVDDLGDGRFLIRRGYEDPDAGPRRSRGEASPFTAVSGQDEVWNRIMGRDRDDDGEGSLGDTEVRWHDGPDDYFLADPSGGGEWIGGTHSGLPEDEFEYEDQNVRGPNYDEPDPFDRSNPVEARQARAIEDMNETLEQ